VKRAFLALGSNVAPRQKFLASAIQSLGDLGVVARLSPLYESRAYGERDQADFLNCALIFRTGLTPDDLLSGLKAIEKKLGRKKRYRWGPREIDIDVIFFEREMIDRPGLKIPHADYQNRRFVLQPLADIAPDFIAPDSGFSLQTALQKCPDASPLILISSVIIQPTKHTKDSKKKNGKTTLSG